MLKKIVLLSHCALNSQCELPEASDFYRKRILYTLMEKGYSIVQLPCPELCYQALERTSIEPGDEKSRDYKDYCKALLEPVISNLAEYKKHNIQIAGIVGIDTSPSCSVMNKDAIMISVLLEEALKKGIKMGKLIDMPVTDNEEFNQIDSL